MEGSGAGVQGMWGRFRRFQDSSRFLCFVPFSPKFSDHAPFL